MLIAFQVDKNKTNRTFYVLDILAESIIKQYPRFYFVNDKPVPVNYLKIFLRNVFLADKKLYLRIKYTFRKDYDWDGDVVNLFNQDITGHDYKALMIYGDIDESNHVSKIWWHAGMY